MNIYLVPIYDAEEVSPEILSFKAKSLSSAEDKVVNYFQNKYDFEGFLGGEDWEDFCMYCGDQLGIVIGDLYDIEEFEDRSRY